MPKKYQNKEIPLLSIEKSLDVYKGLHAPNPSFGMDLYKDNFEGKELVLLVNNGNENKGIPIKCDHFVIILCKNGSSHRRINHHRFQISTHSAHIILPGQIHSFSNTESGFEIYVLLFERAYIAKTNFPPQFLDSLLNVNANCLPNMKLNKAEFSEWFWIFNQIDIEIKTNKKYQREVIRTHIIHLMHLVNRKLYYQNPDKQKYSRPQLIFSEFKNLIELHFQTRRSVQQYADMLKITPKHLSETVKSISNHTAMHFIRERIIREAEYLLVYTSLSIKEIAFKLNFDSPSHFGRFFKNRTKATPLNFRTLYK